MRPNDQATKDHIEFLEDHASNLEVENQELKQELQATKAQILRMQSDRECVD